MNEGSKQRKKKWLVILEITVNFIEIVCFFKRYVLLIPGNTYNFKQNEPTNPPVTLYEWDEL